jgi:hypothetical protein
MKFTLAMLIIALLVAAASSQEKPTMEQCRADFNAWKSMSDSDRDALGVRELQRRFGEMTSCSEIEDKDLEMKNKYFSAAVVFDDLICTRHLKFLMRHKLLQHFLDEDGAGQR